MGVRRRPPHRRWDIPFVCMLSGLVAVSMPTTGWGDPPMRSRISDERGQRAVIESHDLDITIVPHEHRLRVLDRQTVAMAGPEVSEITLRFHLADRLQIEHAAQIVGSSRRALAMEEHPDDKGGGKQIIVRPTPVAGPIILEWMYGGLIDDPPRESRHLRFVTPSETSGHIGDEGVYLSGETSWYPDLPGSLPTFRARVTVPEGWETVTHGRQISKTRNGATVTTMWDVEARTEALSLVANRFVVASRQWRDPGGRVIETATYLFSSEAHLAEEYLQAAIRYLETYTAVLGPYPFPKFAVVENFFPSGLGMPSFTLLGSGVIKRHYVQPYALGHEIVHSWIGNWIFNDPETGNWVEGLTTYLANYYYEERTGTPEQAAAQRRMMLLGYAVYVAPEEDYPLERFRSKTDQKDNAIGYQKSAMVFHMLRREVGDEVFWAGLRRLVSEYGGRHATWNDVERLFTKEAGQDLHWFFDQWVKRAGAPRLEMAPPETTGTQDGYTVAIRIRQDGVPYRLRVPVHIALQDRPDTWAKTLNMERPEELVQMQVPARPLTLRIDPGFETFRRLDRRRLPPMLNLYATDSARSLVLPATPERAAPYEEVASRLAAQASASPPTVKRVSEGERPFRGTDVSGSVLVLGGPGANPAAEWAIGGCGGHVQVAEDRFTIKGRTYQDPLDAVLVSCRRTDDPHRVVTLFYGLTPAASEKVARLLFFYGWHSYLVFRNGVVESRGDFDHASPELEAPLHAQ